MNSWKDIARPKALPFQTPAFSGFCLRQLVPEPDSRVVSRASAVNRFNSELWFWRCSGLNRSIIARIGEHWRGGLKKAFSTLSFRDLVSRLDTEEWQTLLQWMSQGINRCRTSRHCHSSLSRIQESTSPGSNFDEDHENESILCRSLRMINVPFKQDAVSIARIDLENVKNGIRWWFVQRKQLESGVFTEHWKNRTTELFSADWWSWYFDEKCLQGKHCLSEWKDRDDLSVWSMIFDTDILLFIWWLGCECFFFSLSDWSLVRKGFVSQSEKKILR